MNFRITPNWSILAGLRFFLCVIVVVAHLCLSWRNPVFAVIEQLDAMCAVWAFLMISGFSIAHSIRRQPSGFYARRIRRIYPMYLMCLLLALAAAALGFLFADNHLGGRSISTFGLISHFFFGQLFLTPALNTFCPSWSLCIEVVFYAAAPLLIAVRGRVLALAVLVSALAMLINPFSLPRVHDFPNLVVVLYALWAWVLGWLLAVKPNSYVRVASFVLPIIVISLDHESVGTLGVIPLLLTSLALNYSHKINLSSATKRSLNYLGNLSFPLYLAHFPIWRALVYLGFDSLWLAIFCITAISVFLLRLDDNYSSIIEKRFCFMSASATSTVGHTDASKTSCRVRNKEGTKFEF